VIVAVSLPGHRSPRTWFAKAGDIEIPPAERSFPVRIRTRVVTGLALALALTGCATSSPPASGDGEITEDLTPFDTGYPAIRNLDTALLTAIQKAAVAARARVEFRVTSGWRGKAYQQRLLDEGTEKYGSLEEARKFVNTPEKSAHVTGKAIDIGPTRADDWLIQHGSDYGLCQAYSNEMWHFELLTSPGGECPAPLPNSAG
jgi:D-alanyl-D-alanine carboxypeptidase